METRPYLSLEKEPSALKSIWTCVETTEKTGGNPSAIIFTNCPYLIHVGVKEGPILKVDLHCWVHGEG